MELVCTEATEWVEEEVSQPVEEWEERQEERCKEYPWYDPRGWVCWFVTVLVKIVRWVTVTVGKWVVRTVCKFVTTAIQLAADVLVGSWNVFVGILTLDWRRVVDGLVRIGLGILLGSIRLLRILILGDTIDYIHDEYNEWQLRKHVRRLLEAKYSGETLEQIIDAIRLDHGAFGLRLNATALRTTLDSETPSAADPTIPNLVALHEAGSVNLRELCGFEFNEGFWNRKRYKTLKKGPFLAGGGGFGEVDNPISAEELDAYLASRGQQGPKFIVLPMRDGVHDTKLEAAEYKSRELGLMISFTKREVEVTNARHIVHDGFDTLHADTSIETFLVDPVGRASKQVDAPAATRELCQPMTVGVFRFTDRLHGLAAPLVSSSCGLMAHDASGVTFIDNHPDHIWKYVTIHELGHYFGLCHTDGVNHIMYSSVQNSWWDIWVIPDWLYLEAEPCFTLNQAKATWDYIVANFDARCLGAKA
jgi:hypothetical protein